jgi:hypothetical protein
MHTFFWPAPGSPFFASGFPDWILAVTAIRHLAGDLILLILFGLFALDELILYREYQSCSAVDGRILLGGGTRIVSPT